MAIYKSYIDIYSPGTFPENIEPERFIEEEIKPIRRNPLIARTLYYSKDMESFATGLKRIYDACAEAGVKVEFKREPYGFTVRFHRHCGEGWENGRTSEEINTSTEKKHTSTETDIEIRFTDTERKMMEIIKHNPVVTISEMAKLCGISRGGAQYVLNSLKSKGKVHREGAHKNGRWIIND